MTPLPPPRKPRRGVSSVTILLLITGVMLGVAALGAIALYILQSASYQP